MLLGKGKVAFLFLIPCVINVVSCLYIHVYVAVFLYSKCTRSKGNAK